MGFFFLPSMGKRNGRYGEACFFMIFFFLLDGYFFFLD